MVMHLGAVVGFSPGGTLGNAGRQGIGFFDGAPILFGRRFRLLLGQRGQQARIERLETHDVALFIHPQDAR